MITIFQASAALQQQFSDVRDERGLLALILDNLHHYHLATRVKHAELDIAFAATGGPSNWVYGDSINGSCAPEPERESAYGDILVELANGYVNLSTPAGFIPLVDVEEHEGTLRKKQLN